MPEFPTEGDLADFEQRRIDVQEIDRQLRALRNPAASIELLRPCLVDRGITVLPPAGWEDLEQEWERAARGARLMKFVPASGAATRMFSFLKRYLETGEGETSSSTARFLASLDKLPFPEDPTALGDLARRPKGLLPFHDYGSEQRSALAEQLFEATTHLDPRGGTQRLHFTVSAEHLPSFEAEVEALGTRLGRDGWNLEVSFSTQDPSTDTLAATPDGEPARTAEGRLLFRPAGHGALIENLERTLGDLVFIKNIDNIARRERHEVNGRWKRRLAGHLIRTQRLVWELLDLLEDDRSSDEAIRDALARLRDLGLSPGVPPTRRAALIESLDRPLRVCGVVENLGEPGGGPFWIRHSDGRESPQIVEAAQVAVERPEQAAIWESATHFNPVDLVCALRDRHGNPYPLERFVDPSASIVSVKQDGEHRIKVLERPGLWNGAMAGWNTLFVEVPQETFTPVKTALDLLRPEHQP